MIYKRHPLSAVWPDMPEGERNALRLDIKERGVQRPITIHDGEILDGWERYSAALAVGAEVKTKRYKGDDPAGYVIALNARRRHLSKKQVAKAVLATREWRKPGRPAKGEEPEAQAPRSTPELAREAGVSQSTIEKVKQEMRGKKPKKQKAKRTPAPDDDPEAGVSNPIQLAAQRRLRDTLNENERLFAENTRLKEVTGDAAESETPIVQRQQSDIEALRQSVAECLAKYQACQQERTRLRKALSKAETQIEALEHALQAAQKPPKRAKNSGMLGTV